MDLSIIIVSWNVKEKLRENLKAIYKSVVTGHRPVTINDLTGRDQPLHDKMEVFVVDNNSADGTAEMVKNELLKLN
jgi:GT2 family glycosyltransferase